MIDNHDSFTYNIYDYLCRIGAEVTVKVREKVVSDDLKKADGIAFSPGPGNPETLPELQNLLRLVVDEKPVLGICLGHQALAFHFGASIVKATPMHGKISAVFRKNESALLYGIPQTFRVVRYHSLLVENLPNCLIPILSTKDDLIMAFQHRTLPLFGIQFHPEAHLSEFGLPLLKNWLDVCVKNQGDFFLPPA